MTKRVHTLGPHNTVFHAASLMAHTGISRLVVVENQKPVGIVTLADLVSVNVLLTPKKRVLGSVGPSDLAEKRFAMLHRIEADLILSTCPSCDQNLGEASAKFPNSKQILDLAELVAQPMGLV